MKFKLFYNINCEIKIRIIPITLVILLVKQNTVETYKENK